MTQLDGMGQPITGTVASLPTPEEVVIPGAVPVNMALGVAPGALDGVKPGPQTSEFKLAISVVGLINLLAGIYMTLATNDVIHPSSELLAIIAAVSTGVSGWVTTNYVSSRATIKAAATLNK